MKDKKEAVLLGYIWVIGVPIWADLRNPVNRHDLFD
jgi:hypothetical protein